MSTLVDTSVLIDVLRGTPGAIEALDGARRRGALHASEITRLEVLAGMRAGEEPPTYALLGLLAWQVVDAAVATEAGVLGRRWRRSHQGIDAADLAVAATARVLGAELLTRNVRHFPMFEGLVAPY